MLEVGDVVRVTSRCRVRHGEEGRVVHVNFSINSGICCSVRFADGSFSQYNNTELALVRKSPSSVTVPAVTKKPYIFYIGVELKEGEDVASFVSRMNDTPEKTYVGVGASPEEAFQLLVDSNSDVFSKFEMFSTSVVLTPQGEVRRITPNIKII